LVYSNKKSKKLEKVILIIFINANKVIINGKFECLFKQILYHLLLKKENQIFRKLFDKTIKDFFNDIGLLNKREALIIGPFSSRYMSTSQLSDHQAEIHQRGCKSASTNRSRTRDLETVEIHKAQHYRATSDASQNGYMLSFYSRDKRTSSPVLEGSRNLKNLNARSKYSHEHLLTTSNKRIRPKDNHQYNKDCGKKVRFINEPQEIKRDLRGTKYDTQS
jgi:hypothetical protein